jgi:hypothetical protein
VKPMIYVNKFGVVNIVDELDELSNTSPEEQIELLDDWKSLS